VEHTFAEAQAQPVSAARARANAIASTAMKSPAVKKFDPITLITLILSVLPELLKCFNPDPEPAPATMTAARAKRYVSGQYDETTGEYEDDLVSRTSFCVLLKAAKMHKITNRDARRAIATAILDDIRSQEEAVVGAVIEEVG